MIQGASRMKSAVSAPRPSRKSQTSVEATAHARRRSPFSSSSLKIGTKAAESAWSATSDADEVRHLEGDREGVDRPLDAEVAADDDLAEEPEDAREAGREREERRRPGQAAPPPGRFGRAGLCLGAHLGRG